MQLCHSQVDVLFKPVKSAEFMLNLYYINPQNADSDNGEWGNINRAYDDDDDDDDEGNSPSQLHPSSGGAGYRLKFRWNVYYCKPYQPIHTQLRYNFSSII